MSQHKPDDANTGAPSLPAAGQDPAGAKAAAGKKPTAEKTAAAPMAPEFGGPSGPEPTRYGDWERNGRVSDF
ncbi:MAG: DUF1674 domain-containing protein [Rhodospirillaceae bacterium]|nr:DUF1674 domain-containing protein [Rhodospirillaceae bacterium]